VIVALALLAATATGQTAADAERAFAAQAQAIGQWPAFRTFAAPDAILYAPGPARAQDVLARMPDAAARLSWRPERTITACDGTLAYSTGPWTRSDGKAGRFSTVWRHGPDGWKWIYDDGHDGAAAAAAMGSPVEEQAACPGPIGAAGELHDSLSEAAIPVTMLTGGARAGLIELADGPLPATLRLGAAAGEGGSADRTLRWRINPLLGGRVGAHLLRVWAWDGRRYRLAVFDVTGITQ
jgi:hypothetical protein